MPFVESFKNQTFPTYPELVDSRRARSLYVRFQLFLLDFN